MSGPEAIGVGARSGAARGSPAAIGAGTTAGKLAEQVYETLKAQLHDFRLVAGDRFSEAELGQRLDFTRADRVEAIDLEHAKILRAVMQRKPDQAQLLLKTHIEKSKAEVRKITLRTLQAARERARD